MIPDFAHDCVRPLSGYMLFFAIFQFVLLLLNCLLICYTEKDTVEEMLIKSGTIGNGRAFQPKPRRRRRDETDDAESVGTSRHRDTETVATNRHRDTESVGTSRHRDTESVGTISRHRHNGDDASVRNV